MKTSVSPIPDPNGQRGLPRTGLFLKRARVHGLASACGQSVDTVARKLYPTLDDATMRAVTAIQAANEVGPTGFPSSVADAQLAAAVAHVAVLGRLPFAIDLPANSHYHALAADVPEASIIGPGEPIPLRAGSFKAANMALRDAKALIAVSSQLLAQPTAEAALNQTLLRATGRAVDAEALRVLLDGADPLAGGAASAEDLRLRIREAVGALIDAGAAAEGVVLVCHPLTALGISTYPSLDGASAFPSVGINGGNISGVPVLTTLGANEGNLIAVASDAVARTILAPLVDASKASSLEFSSAPTGKAKVGQTPVAASQRQVNLWQTDGVALRIIAPFAVAAGRDLVAVEISGVLPSIGTA